MYQRNELWPAIWMETISGAVKYATVPHASSLFKAAFFNTTDWGNKFKACGGRDNMPTWWKNWALGRKAGGKRERGMPANMNFVTRKHGDEHKCATHKWDPFERVCAYRSCEYSWPHITCWSRYIQPEQVEPVCMLICGCGYRVLAVDYRWLVFGIFLLWYPLNVLTPFEAVSVLKISRPFYV